MFSHDIIFYYHLTATQTLTFGYIKWNLYVAFNDSFLDIMFGQYVRRGMGKISTTKNTEYVCLYQFSLKNIAHGVMSVS